MSYSPKESPTKVGLDLGTLVVPEISGPISFVYLRPLAPGFPLILLFGDAHFSNTNRCPQGTSLSDPVFLAALDKLSTIDFYVETSLMGKAHAFKGPLNDFTSGPFLTCYHHRLKGTPLNQCPTKNIRWHAIDTRDASYQLYGTPTQQKNAVMRNLYANPNFTKPPRASDSYRALP